MTQFLLPNSVSIQQLLPSVLSCTHCNEKLPMGAKPIVQLHSDAKIIIASQAPGLVAHNKGIPFLDKSGERLREWLGVDESTFFNKNHFAILPMAFCYPGKGKSGDLAPPPECAKLWRRPLLDAMPKAQVILLMGAYAQQWHLGSVRKHTLTDTVKSWQEYTPRYLPLPHPSPRNNMWLRKNAWFEEDVLPHLKQRVNDIIKR